MLGNVPGEQEIGVDRLPLPSWVYNFDVAVENLTFKGIYDRLVSHQLTALGEDILPRQRVAKERAARSVAAEFVLASAVVKVIDVIEEPDEEEAIQDTTAGAEPLHSTTSDTALSQSALARSQGLPESSLPSAFGQKFSLPFHPSPLLNGKGRAIEPLTFQSSSYAPSQASISHASFATGHSETSTRAVVDRLSRFCEIRKPPLGKNPRPTTLLAHWTVGEDPGLYNWSETTAAIEKAQEEAAMSPSERQREWKRRMKLERQKRKEEEKWRKLQMVSSSQPVVLDSRQLEEEERARNSKSRSRGRQSLASSMSRGVSVSTTGREGEHGSQKSGLGANQGLVVGTGQRSVAGTSQAATFPGHGLEHTRPPKKKRKKRRSGF
jgi:hypothetical protein